MSKSSSKLAVPSGARNSPVGAMSPATSARPPAASFDIAARRRLNSRTRLNMPADSSLTRFAPKVGV